MAIADSLDVQIRSTAFRSLQETLGAALVLATHIRVTVMGAPAVPAPHNVTATRSKEQLFLVPTTVIGDSLELDETRLELDETRLGLRPRRRVLVSTIT